MRIKNILLIITAFTIVSCDDARRSETYRLLEDVEGYMAERPDSALAVLGRMDIQNDDYGQMLIHYAQGRVQSENADYPASIISFFNAEKTAKELNNPYVLGLIYYSVSDIYAKTFNHIEQQNYAQMAYDQFVLSGNQNCILSGLEALAEAHYYNKDYDRCAKLSQQLLETADGSNDWQVRANGLRLLSKSYIKAGRYEEAKDLLLELIEQSETDLTPQDYRNLCLAYIKTGDFESANAYRKYAQEDEQKSMWVVIKDPATGKPLANIFDLEEPVASQDTVTRKIINQNLAQTVASYHAYEQSMKEAELRSERMSKVVIIIIASVLLVFLCIWYRMHLKAHRKEMEMKMLEAENIRHILKVTKEDASAMQSSVNQLFEQKFKSIDELCNTYYVYQGSQNERTKIYNNVISIISNLSKDRKTILELEAFVNTYKGNLMADFRSEFPALKDEDYLLFLYIVVDFSSRAVSILIGESLPVVYNRKSSLKRKIQQSDSPMKERFLAEFA